MADDTTEASPDVAVNILHDPLATEDSPDVAENISDDRHPSAAVPPPVARAPNRNSLTTIKNRRSRFSELIEPLSLESETAADDRGTISLPPTDSDSDDPTPGSLLAPKWLFSFAGVILVISIITVSPLKHHLILGRHLWKLPALLLAAFCALLLVRYTVLFACSVAPRPSYVFYRMPKAIRTCFCIALVYSTCVSCFDESVLSIDVRNVFDDTNRALRAVVLASAIWHVKIIMFELFRVAFHRKRFYERLKGAALDLYMLDRLMDRAFGDDEMHNGNGEGMMKWIMEMADEMMAEALNTSRMHPRDDADRLLLEYMAEDQPKNFKAAQEALNQSRFITRKDMENFLTKEEVDIAFSLMEDPCHVGNISELSFVEWMVEAYQRRKSLVHAIIDTDTIVWKLNVLASKAMAMIMFMITLILAGVTTPKVLVAFFSQILLLGFMFQNTAKTIFECIVFVFVRQPFDVGDCCIIDGVKMIVEQINIMDTVFLRLDHEIIKYPNSELSKKPISNWSRSPQMSETIEFSIGISTRKKSVGKLRKHIKQYLESKPEFWQPKHSLFITGIEDSKMKMDLNVLHRKSYKNFHELKKRKSELLFELNTIFQNLGIENYAIPKETTPVINGKDDTPVENPPRSMPVPHG